MGQTHSHKLMASLLGLIFLSVFALLPQPTFADSVVEKFPTSTSVVVAGWNNPTNAYTNNGQYTDSSTGNAAQEYSGFNFAMNDTDTIEDVTVYVEFTLLSNIPAPDMFADVTGQIRVYDGSTWKTYTFVLLSLVGDSAGNVDGSDNLYIGRGINIFDHVKTPAEVNAAKVRLISGFSADPTATFQLQIDYVSVKVAYTPAPTEENMEQYLLVGATMTFFIVLIIKSKKQQP